MTPSPHDPARFLLRPCRPTDHADLLRMAHASADGINSLPANAQTLMDRIQASEHAMRTADSASGEERYLFALEDLRDGRLVGVSGITASAGFKDRFYSYRNDFIVHHSAALGVSNRVHALHLCHDLTGVTLLSSFYIEPELERTEAAQLLSRARLLFIHRFRDRFSDRIAAESPGLANEAGECPFWEAVGRRFFGLDYPAAEQLAGGRHKSFIADLMPQVPIYVPLLPESAQWAIGQLHPVAEAPFEILMEEGFEADTYVDIFDGGPTAEARLGMLRTVQQAREVVAGQPLPPGDWIVCRPDRADFRATLHHVPAEAPVHRLSLADPLGAAPGETLIISPLTHCAGESA